MNNTLKKPIPPRTSLSVSPTKPNTVVSSSVQYVEAELETQALTAREQLWAARAYKAETLLAAQKDHHRELKNLAYTQEIKRNVGKSSRAGTMDSQPLA